MSGSFDAGLVTFLIFVAAVALAGMVYWVPSLVACACGHRNAAAVVMTNFLLGWTGIGWCVALIWACTDYRDEE
jgi:hypothetical protein